MAQPDNKSQVELDAKKTQQTSTNTQPQPQPQPQPATNTQPQQQAVVEEIDNGFQSQYYDWGDGD